MRCCDSKNTKMPQDPRFRRVCEPSDYVSTSFDTSCWIDLPHSSLDATKCEVSDTSTSEKMLTTSEDHPPEDFMCLDLCQEAARRLLRSTRRLRVSRRWANAHVEMLRKRCSADRDELYRQRKEIRKLEKRNAGLKMEIEQWKKLLQCEKEAYQRRIGEITRRYCASGPLYSTLSRVPLPLCPSEVSISSISEPSEATETSSSVISVASVNSEPSTPAPPSIQSPSALVGLGPCNPPRRIPFKPNNVIVTSKPDGPICIRCGRGGPGKLYRTCSHVIVCEKCLRNELELECCPVCGVLVDLCTTISPTSSK